jgi:hypothetical protein
MRCSPAWWNTLDLLAWPGANGQLKFDKRGQLFISAHKTLSVVAVRAAIQIVRPLESIADRQPQLQPALLRLSAMISQYFTPGFCPFFALQSNAKVNVNPLALGSS